MTHLDSELFWSTFGLIFVSELPDKTAFATLLLATRKNPYAIFVGVALAFVIQSVIAVSFGSALALLPRVWVRSGTGVLFLGFAVAMWLRKEEEERTEAENVGSSFLKTALESFVVIFIAEWGDLTQLATATLQARYRDPVTILISAILALWCVTALAIIVGNRAKKVIQPVVLQKIAAGAFVVVGAYFLLGA
jgi:putative Ca2+/H+ antiporter (TMEM165/GDT1 family)